MRAGTLIRKTKALANLVTASPGMVKTLHRDQQF